MTETEAPTDGDLAEVDQLLAELKLPAHATQSGSMTQMLPTVYDELRRVAAGYLRSERSGHTLQPTALVHEAYMRLSHQHGTKWANRSHFLCIAARMMRRVLTNHAVARAAEKRGGENAVRFTLDDEVDYYTGQDLSLVAVNDALGELERLDARQGEIVELRFFGGLTIEEIAEALEISPRTVKREWATAKHWLRRELTKAD
ncbi:MAG: sigma-70 family RNA polymerase sigma factor [Verrucomicrobiota bacterium]|nr:sigma-70 family RNA polymerase sigma factor [Verrucomicrobiota bacterium]